MPPLSAGAQRRLDVLFRPEDRAEAGRLLTEECGHNISKNEDPDRLRFAAMKCSDGNLHRLRAAIGLGQTDYRDLLMAAGFGWRVDSYHAWEPTPHGDPPLVDASKLAEQAAGILAPLLSGFARENHQWQRDCHTEGPLRQKVELQKEVSPRTEARLTITVRWEAPGVKVILRLPRLESGINAFGPRCYVLEKGDHAEALIARIEADFRRHALPWLKRFVTPAELNRGLNDGTFMPRQEEEAGKHWLL